MEELGGAAVQPLLQGSFSTRPFCNLSNPEAKLLACGEPAAFVGSTRRQLVVHSGSIPAHRLVGKFAAEAPAQRNAHAHVWYMWQHALAHACPHSNVIAITDSFRLECLSPEGQA